MSDKLAYFSRSADKYPGRGTGERVEDETMYSGLATIPNWRRMLSSLWVQEFVYKGLPFMSVDHALCFEKFRSSGYDEIGFMFAKPYKYGKLPPIEATRTGRTVKILTMEELDNWEKNRYEYKFLIYQSKFSISPLKQVLLLTRQAELWNRGPRLKPMRSKTLERTRTWLVSQQVNNREISSQGINNQEVNRQEINDREISRQELSETKLANQTSDEYIEIQIN